MMPDNDSLSTDATRSAGQPREAASPPYILVVEDDPANADLLKALIEQELCIGVLVAADGRAGLDLVAQATPLTVVVDLMLPGIDGEAFIDELRQMPEGRSLPLIVVSALSRDRVRTAADRAAARSITKPFDVEELLSAVADAVAPWFAAALDNRPADRLTELFRRSLQSDLDLLLERSWRILAHARDAGESARRLLREAQTRHVMQRLRP